MDKFNIFKTKLQGIAKTTYTQIKNLPNQVKPFTDQLQLQFRPSDQDLIQITDRLYWMTFPTNNKIQSLSKHLNQQFQNNYYIWNVSEHEYPTEFFLNQVANHVHKGYPCPPLLEIFTIVKGILTWLHSDEQNIAIVQCQQAKGRSLLILSIIVALRTKLNPGEVLLRIANMTNVRDYQALFPSQHLYLTYAENAINGLKPNQTPLRLVSVILSQIPKNNKKMKFAPYLQLFSRGKICYNSLQGSQIKRYESEDNSVLFQIGGLELHDDILLRCKHFENNEKRVSFFRVMFHCGFVFNNVLRFAGRELDMSSEFQTNKEFFIDLIFERGIQKSSQTKEVPNNTTKLGEDQVNNLIIQVQGCQQLAEQKDLQIDDGPWSFPKQLEAKQELSVQEPIQDTTHQKEQKQEVTSTEVKSAEIEIPNISDDEDEPEKKKEDHSELMQKILESDHKDQDLDDEDDYISTLTQDI